MQSGLARLGYGGVIALLLVPAFLVAGVQIGTRWYCAKSDRTTFAQNATLLHVVEMETALQQARTAVRSVPGDTAHDFAGTEEFGRWLHAKGKQQHVLLQNLTLKNDPSANPITPAFMASFHVEQPVPQLILLLQNIQSPQRLVLYDTIHLQREGQSDPPVYGADITLHSYTLTGLKKKIEP